MRPGNRARRAAACLALGAVIALGAGCGDGGNGGSSGAAAPATRGVIEGFYGPLYDFDARLDLLRFLPQAGLNTYVYAPKSDPYHRSQWRDPYPDEWIDHFAALVRTAHEIGVRFVFALSPGTGFDPSGDDHATLERKLGTLFDVGVRDFCLLFDDLVASSAAADPRVQVQIVTDTLSFLRARDADTRLCFISNYYAGTADDVRADRTPFDGTFAVSSSAAYAAYAALPADVAILWTGPHVFANPLTVADAAAFHDLVARPLVVWDNFPVNDVLLSHELFLSPYREREAGIGEAVDGVLLNTMLQPEASKIALWTAGRFFADGEGYDPDAALQEALTRVAGSAAGARVLARLADQFRSHPLIGDERESPMLADRAAAFFASQSPASEAALRTLLQSFAATADDLAHAVPNARLVSELTDPARKLSLYGEAGLLGLDLLDQAARGEAVDTAALQARLDAARTIPWLVGANTTIGSGLDLFLSGRPAVHADEFGDFFSELSAALAAHTSLTTAPTS